MVAQFEYLGIITGTALTRVEEEAYEGSPLRKAAHSHGENSIIGLEKGFVPQSAGAHSMAKMRGLFEPNQSLGSRSIVGEGAPPGLLRLL